MVKYRHIALTVKSDMPQKEQTLLRVLRALKQAGATVFIDEKRCKDAPCAAHLPGFGPKTGIDAVVCVGGDGTILRAVREFGRLRVPFITINRGTLGFLAELSLDDAVKHLKDLLDGRGVLETRATLSVSVKRGKKKIYDGIALNETVIAQGAIARLIELPTTVNRQKLTTFHADGLIVSTPTGSTAYSLAAGGPILHPHLSALILTPINPHSFSQKPLVLPGHLPVELTVHARERVRDTEVGLSLDGQEYLRLQDEDRVTIHIAPEPISFLRLHKDTFFSVLRAKLKWGEGPDAASH